MVEIDEAVAFYESKREGLGMAFFDDYQATLRKLAEGPLPGTLITRSSLHHRLCRVFFDVFPYKLIVADFPHEYGIVAVARQGRRQGYWKARLAKVKP